MKKLRWGVNNPTLVPFKIFIVFAVCIINLPNIVLAQKDSVLQAGIALYENGDYAKSIEVLQARLKIANEKNEKKVQAIIYNDLGNDYSNTGATVLALEAYQHSISLAEELGDKNSIAKSMKNIGAIYADTKDFEKALQKYKEAEDLAISIHDTGVIADCANNKGLIYEQQKKYDEALSSYRKAIELYRILQKKDRMAILYNNLGIVYKYLKDYDKAIECYNESLKLSEQIGSKFLMGANQINIGNVYEMKGDYKMAIALNEQGLNTGKEINAQELIIEAYNSLAEDHAKQGDYKEGYDLFKKYVEVKDSFISIERSKQLAEMQTKYETEKKEKQIISLEKSRYLMLAVIGIMVLLIIMAYLLYSRQQLKQKQAKAKAILTAETNERLRIAKDVHDDLGAGLSKISLIAGIAQTRASENQKANQDIHDVIRISEQLQQSAIDISGLGVGGQIAHPSYSIMQEGLKELLIKSENIGNIVNVNTALGNDIMHIADVSRELIDNMRDLIWVLNPENTTLDQLIARLREYTTDYIEDMPFQLNVNIPDKIPDTTIRREAQRNIFLIVKEAFNNCLKHSKAKTISLVIKFDHDKMSITIADDGVGFNITNAKGGNGLRNMMQRIGSIGGSFNIISATGETKVTIDIPFEKLSDSRILL